jgi:hypothetical protein
MADTAMMRMGAISPDEGKRVDNRMVSIDTFLSVGTTGGRLLGPERSRSDHAFLPDLRSIVVKAFVEPDDAILAENSRALCGIDGNGSGSPVACG